MTNWREQWSALDSIKYIWTELGKRTTFFKRFYYCIDAYICNKKYGSAFHDYISLRFFERPAEERKTFLTTDIVKFEKKKWDQEKIIELDDKARFNEMFPEYIKREWIDIDSASEESVKDFLARYQEFIIKPRRESSGIGIRKCLSADVKDVKEFCQNTKGCVIEELVTMCDDFNRLCSTGITQVRVVTVYGKSGAINILATSLRTVGNPNVSINTSKDDIFSQIDIQTGKCLFDATDKMGVHYKTHPFSDVEFVGFQIPLWDEIKEACVKCAKRIPEVKLIGWDVTVTDKGVVLFEGNPGSGVLSMQMSDGIGKKDLFFEYLER